MSEQKPCGCPADAVEHYYACGRETPEARHACPCVCWRCLAGSCDGCEFACGLKERRTMQRSESEGTRAETARHDDLDRLEALTAKASPAPWDAKVNRHRDLGGLRWGWVDGAVNITWNGQAEADAEAIAAIRNEMPSLFAELRRLRAQRRPTAPDKGDDTHDRDLELAEFWLNESMDEEAIGHVRWPEAPQALRRLLESVRREERQRRERAAHCCPTEALSHYESCPVWTELAAARKVAEAARASLRIWERATREYEAVTSALAEYDALDAAPCASTGEGHEEAAKEGLPVVRGVRDGGQDDGPAVPSSPELEGVQGGGGQEGSGAVVGRQALSHRRRGLESADSSCVEPFPDEVTQAFIDGRETGWSEALDGVLTALSNVRDDWRKAIVLGARKTAERDARYEAERRRLNTAPPKGGQRT